ncbi:hypothetical protein M436DRAFT_56418 [Aureobasidium namibiae CBS 147.97]|uniref:Uncharacterized protein n=1 Tax=Aureobasidium namibiae CBS 147.97 TaxID=1043004 RepID=A0A074WCE2_9PEZI
MPPLRSIPAAKPVKTERTHEENQERAYIAASRRSDRSLEARVESARRASEIHKRRTGRSLRVTEQDVINEEMYEEEDDDLPMQYRRLTAHLQTSNADFDRRLAAYLTNHVAMRAALGQTMGDQYNNQQYSNAPQFANQLGQFPQSFPNPMLPPQMANRSPQSFRASPYPQQAFRQTMHGRSASIATPQELQNMNNYPQVQSPNATFIKPEDRRMSLPVQSQQNAAPSPPHLTAASRTSSSTSLTNLKHEAAKQGNGQTSPTGQTSPAAYSASYNQVSPAFDPSMMNMMPFSTSLPHESQQLLGPGFDQNDAFSQMLMGGYGQQQSQPFYTYNPNPSKFKGGSPCFDGINQTLAPGMLDTNMDKYPTPMSGVDSALTPSNTFGFDNFDPLKGFSHNNVSGMTTPGENDWSSLLDSNAWEEQASQSAVAN